MLIKDNNYPLDQSNKSKRLGKENIYYKMLLEQCASSKSPKQEENEREKKKTN